MEIDKELGENWKEGYSSSSLSKNGVKLLPRAAFSDVLEVLMSITNTGIKMLLRMLLDAQIGELVLDGRLLPRAVDLATLNIAGEADRKRAFRPMIYALVHCDENGKAPTILEYRRVVERMRQYLSTDGDEWVENDAYARIVDYGGRDSNPRIPKDRDWSIKAGSNPKWAQNRHPRRYVTSESSRQNFHVFLEKFEERIKYVVDKNHAIPSQPLPWQLTYVGWTNKFERRKGEHYRHIGGQDIKALVETITYLECEPKRYFMRMIPIMNVCSPVMIRAEHVISLLTSSYAYMGGLNAVSGGSAKDCAAAYGNNPQACWDAGLSALYIQMAEIDLTLDDYHRQAEMDDSFKEVREVDEDIARLNEELQKLKEATEVELKADIRSFRAFYNRLMTQLAKDEVAIDQFVVDMAFIYQADLVIDFYPDIIEDSQPS